jgi:2-keto-4-pentenoate hydratase
MSAAFDPGPAASILIAARRNKLKIADLPTRAQPVTIEDGYAIQDAIALLNPSVCGWKASFEPDGETARVAPVAAEYVLASEADAAMPGPVRVEVEFAVKLIVDLPQNAAPFDRATVDKAIGPALVVFEILGTRFADRKMVSPHAYLADGNGNDAIVTGEEIADWRSLDLAVLDVRLHVNGHEAGQSQAGAPFSRVLDLVTALANHAALHLGGLKAGQVIITGARVGPVSIEAGSVAVGSINGQAKVALKIS